jgi:phosphatidylglycerol:prolipoprotein diacylglycerol transferase
MFPTIFDSAWLGLSGDFHFRIPTYTTMLILGWVLAVVIADRDTQKMGINRNDFRDFAIWMLIVGTLGSRVAHVLMDGFFWDYIHLCTDPFAIEGKSLPTAEACFANSQCLAAQDRGLDIGGICLPEDGLCYPQKDCFRWLKFWAGGLTVYGGLVACVIVGRILMKRYKMPVRTIMDMGGYGIPLGLAVGRLGCLGGGCCFGDICHIDGIGIQFPSGTVAYQAHFEHHYAELSAQWAQGIKSSLPVWPTQLISVTYNFAIFCIAYFWVRPRKRYHGQVLLTTVFLYAACRFGIEFIRADPRGAAFGLSTSQLIALATSVSAGLVLMRLRGGGAAKTDRPSAPDEEE